MVAVRVEAVMEEGGKVAGLVVVRVGVRVEARAAVVRVEGTVEVKAGETEEEVEEGMAEKKVEEMAVATGAVATEIGRAHV